MELVSSRVVYRNPWMTVREDEVRRADGIHGWLRWGHFWDDIPFMNLVFVREGRRNEGLGTRLIRHWEDQQRASGHDTVMTSTLATEKAQHLYRRLGYADSGCLLLPGEPLEILFTKALAK